LPFFLRPELGDAARFAGVISCARKTPAARLTPRLIGKRSTMRCSP
jgi:hypothetical protein